MAPKPYYITTSIVYGSQKPHIGNLYEVILCDAIARMKRLEGRDVRFLTGSDEHGQKIEDYAKAAGVTPKEHVDGVIAEIKSIYSLLNIQYDQFIRTTDKEHMAVVQKMFKRFFDQGDIYKSEYKGWYCKPCESFYTETQVNDGCCPDCGAKVAEAQEEAYFFRMSKYQKQLEDYLEAHPDFITPEFRRREMINNFLKPGLQDLCVSRTSFSWGIPVDFDPRHVVYVWLDALSNYISALGFNPDSSEHAPEYSKFWPADVHVIGKDILRFHSIYWPIFLMAMGEPLPKTILAHPWFLFGNDKMSKSKGNLIYADGLADLVSPDGVRYYALSEMPFASDGNITYETVVERYNSDLANTLGNLVNRSIAMSQKYFQGVLTPGDAQGPDQELVSLTLEAAKSVPAKLDEFQCAASLEDLMALARRANKYIDETMPWALAKNPDDLPRLKAVLYNLAEVIRYLAVLLQPFIPDTAGRIFSQLNCPENLRSLISLQNFGALQSGHVLGVQEPLFQRLDDKVLDELAAKAAAIMEKSEAAKAPATATDTEIPQLKPEITIDDFAKADLRVALVVSCEKVPKSDKLLLLHLDDGFSNDRQIVSGIAQWYAPDDLIGKKIIVVANLKPAKLRGVLSQGMLLAADAPDGAASVIFPDQSLPLGSKIR